MAQPFTEEAMAELKAPRAALRPDVAQFILMNQLHRELRVLNTRIEALLHFEQQRHRHTLLLDQRNRVLTGEQRVLLLEGGAGVVNEFVIVAPNNAYAVSILVDGQALLDEVAWTDLETTGPHVQHIVATERSEGFALSLADISFLEAFEVHIRTRAQGTFPILYASVDVERGVRMSPPPGFQRT